MLIRLLFLLLFCGSLALAGEPTEYTLIQDKASIPLLNAGFSERQTAKITLQNGLQAFIVSDPFADTSGAALIVEAGNWDDPAEAPGIAHFLEHMLFLGTEKYPSEAEFQTFVKKNNGSLNAYTTTDSTCYMFSINHNVFPEALDRFSEFFKHPLFNPSGVDRELNAIDQEHAKNIINDPNRLFFVLKELTTPEHPFHYFSTGNKASLSNVSSGTLRKWYEDHYSANLMHLVIYSNEPIETLKTLVVNDFQGIPNKHLKPYRTDIPIIPNDLKGSLIRINSIKDIRTVTLLWELPPSLVHLTDSKPEKIAAHLLGFEGENSLLEQLKKEKLAEEITVGDLKLNGDTALFAVGINLTEQGLTDINEVIEQFFQAVATYKEKEVPEYLYNDLKNLSITHYQYQPRQNTYQKVLELAKGMIEEDLDTFPEKTHIIQTFNPKAVKEILNTLTPENAVIIISARSHGSEGKSFRKEKWMGVEYGLKKISSDDLNTWREAQPLSSIDLPAPNPFIPDHLVLIDEKEGSPHLSSGIPQPTIVLNNDSMKLYVAPDRRFLDPKISWNFEIKTPEIDGGNPIKSVMGDLYIKRLTEELSTLSYPAAVAGLSYGISLSESGVQISLYGYSEHAHRLFDEILKKLKNLTLSEQTFKTDKETLKMGYQNGAQESSLQQGIETLKSLLTKDFSSKKQKSLAVGKVTFQKFKDYLSSLYATTYTTGMLYGNMPASQAQTLGEKLSIALSSVPYPAGRIKQPRIMTLPEKTGPYLLMPKLKTNSNAVILTIQQIPFSYKMEAAHQVLDTAMSSAFFDELRTKQQTGYIVQSFPLDIRKNLFQLFAIQSNSHNPRDLLARIELFIETFIQEITHSGLTEESFQQIKASSLSSLERPPQNIQEMGALLKEMAFKFDGDFELISKRIQGIKELTYDECIKTARQWFGKENKRRLAILIKGSLAEENQFDYIPLKGINEAKKLCIYNCNKSKE